MRGLIIMPKSGKNTIILGAGITGLAAGYKSGFPVFEAQERPGGICASYYMKAGENLRFDRPPEDKEAYRFEIGGGHWIFGQDLTALDFIRSLVEVKSYARKSSVYFHDRRLFVPYPIQQNLKYLGPVLSEKVLLELRSRKDEPATTLKKWLNNSFGETLCKIFFYPFHELYTAGLYDKIQPQDQKKTPLKTSSSLSSCAKVGYNATFVYPKKGLDSFIRALSRNCDIRYNKKVINIDLSRRLICFADGSSQSYERIVSTLPLVKMLELTGLKTKFKADPYTSVLELNIGAVRGKKCPTDHWVYVPYSKSGFFRVGFYNNVEKSFLPRSFRRSDNRVGIYVERSFNPRLRPSFSQIRAYKAAVITELKSWGFISGVEVIDTNWIEVAYTWTWKGSLWRQEALRLLKEQNITQIGRYGKWKFQGIAESIKEGLEIID